MRLSNTMMINESLLPTGKRAFTLAEVLITLSILGVVAALTIPTLVNRQSDLAAQTKIKKAISAYEDVIGIYMAENEATSASLMMGPAKGTTGADANMAKDCSYAGNYFKIVDKGATDCDFTTADGAAWHFDAATGNATVVDSATAPRYGVIMWNLNSRVNSDGQANNTDNLSSSLSTTIPLFSKDSTTGEVTLVNGSRGAIDAIQFMKGTYFCPQGQVAKPSAKTGGGYEMKCQ